MENRLLGSKLIAVSILRRNQVLSRTTDCSIHPGQLPVLEIIMNCPGLTQREIAERLRVTPASVALSTKRLQKAGMLEKRVDSDNLRCNRLYATEFGEKAAQIHRKCFDEVDEVTFAGFSETDKQQMLAFMERMLHNLSNGEEFELCPLWKGER